MTVATINLLKAAVGTSRFSTSGSAALGLFQVLRGPMLEEVSAPGRQGPASLRSLPDLWDTTGNGQTVHRPSGAR